MNRDDRLAFWWMIGAFGFLSAVGILVILFLIRTALWELVTW